MVYLSGTQTEARSVKPGQLLEMFDSSWKVRNIWDGVKLEVAEDPSPVVLHSFTHLDPDLPLVESSTQEIGEEAEEDA
ncbi:ral guanine nucleotide dissociation stimulator, partial [Austrofundulus limnaeus]